MVYYILLFAIKLSQSEWAMDRGSCAQSCNAFARFPLIKVNYRHADCKATLISNENLRSLSAHQHCIWDDIHTEHYLCSSPLLVGFSLSFCRILNRCLLGKEGKSAPTEPIFPFMCITQLPLPSQHTFRDMDALMLISNAQKRTRAHRTFDRKYVECIS